MRETAIVQPEAPLPRVQVLRITCQFCGSAGPRVDDYRGHWTTGIDINKVELIHESGYSCPDGGSSEQEFYDCCPSCWTTKVKPALDPLLLPSETVNQTERDW